MGINFQISTYQPAYFLNPYPFFCRCFVLRRSQVGSIQKSPDQMIFATPNEARSVFFLSFCNSPPHTSALLFCFSVLCLRVMETVLLKMLSSKLIYLFTRPQQKFFVYYQ